MSPYTNFLAPRSSLSGRIQIGHKSGLLFIFIFIIIIIYSVNIKPTRHRFGFSLAWDWQNGFDEIRFPIVFILNVTS